MDEYYVSVHWPAVEKGRSTRPYGWQRKPFLDRCKTFFAVPAMLYLSDYPFTFTAEEWAGQFRALVEEETLAGFRPQPKFNVWKKGMNNPLKTGLTAKECIKYFESKKAE